jgi:hypothetical protein
MKRSNARLLCMVAHTIMEHFLYHAVLVVVDNNDEDNDDDDDDDDDDDNDSCLKCDLNFVDSDT